MQTTRRCGGVIACSLGRSGHRDGCHLCTGKIRLHNAAPTKLAQALSFVQIQAGKTVGTAQCLEHPFDPVTVGIGLDHGPDPGSLARTRIWAKLATSASRWIRAWIGRGIVGSDFASPEMAPISASRPPETACYNPAAPPGCLHWPGLRTPFLAPTAALQPARFETSAWYQRCVSKP